MMNLVGRNMDPRLAESVTGESLNLTQARIDRASLGPRINSAEEQASAREGKSSAAAWQPNRLRCAILLGGTVRSSPFGAAIKRSLLDLPIDDGGGGQTLLGHWGQEFSRLAASLGLPRIVVRVVIGRNCFAPQTLVAAQGVQLGVERDPVEFRGTGGVLRDLAEVYDDDDLLLVAVANQLSAEPLVSRVRRFWIGDAGGGERGSNACDAALLAGPNMEPTGLFLLRCGCLRDIAASGFVDLKEQAMPAIARNHSVLVVRGDSGSYSIRRWSEYLVALRHRHRSADESDQWAYQEQWQPRFSVIENGAAVDPTAGVHDSVVLAGGRVDAHCTLVRTLVAPGGVVAHGQTVVDRLVTAAGLNE
jgi:hypothetical protein